MFKVPQSPDCEGHYVLWTQQFALTVPPSKAQGPVVQKVYNSIHRINRYPVDKYQQNKPRYPLDNDLSGG